MRALPSFSELNLRRVAVFGAGLSGRAAVQLCQHLGLQVTLFDEGGKGDATEFRAGDLAQFDAFIVSPGFAATHPWRSLVEGSEKWCFSELGFAAWLWQGRLIGITGTNGKTTVTSLLADALENCGHRAVAAGNIGRPLSSAFLEFADDPDVWAVCEISSFQAELPFGISLDGLIWTNLSEDHMDRYGSIDAYGAAKARLIDCLKPGAPMLLGKSVPHSAGIRAEMLSWANTLDSGSPFTRLPQRKNYNLAAELWARLGLPETPLLDAANHFHLAPHRMALVSTFDGVRFWDDSKATNFHATRAAIAGMDGPIYWIGGGSSKGGQIDRFAHELGQRVTASFVYGEAGEELAVALSSKGARAEYHPVFDDAVRAASTAALDAGSGSVLMSPGFASFDQFRSYAERGECFISTVLSLKQAVSSH